MLDFLKMVVILATFYAAGSFFTRLHEMAVCYSIVRCGPVNTTPYYW